MASWMDEGRVRSAKESRGVEQVKRLQNSLETKSDPELCLTQSTKKLDVLHQIPVLPLLLKENGGPATHPHVSMVSGAGLPYEQPELSSLPNPPNCDLLLLLSTWSQLAFQT